MDSTVIVIPLGTAITQLTEALIGYDFWTKSLVSKLPGKLLVSLSSIGLVSSKNKLAGSGVNGMKPGSL